MDENGREVSKAYEEYPPPPREVGINEQLADAYWRACRNTMQRALSKVDRSAEAVAAAIVTTTRDCITLVDKKGKALAPTVTWIDFRSTDRANEMSDELGPRGSVKKIMWFAENRPDLFKKTNKILPLDALINYQLCGEMLTDPSNARYGPIDHETFTWSEEMCEKTGIPMDILAEIVDPAKVIGDVNSEASKATGLRKGTPVIMGSGDQQCSALGTGTVKTGVVKATTGTGTFVLSHTDDFIEDAFVMFCNPAAIPGQFILEGAVPGTGLAYKWFRDQYCEPETILAARTDRDVWEVIEASSASVPAGCDGLVFFPWMAYDKGIFYNLGFKHTKAHIARAIMEANGYAIQFYLQMMEGLLDLEFEEIQIDGGGSNSPLWRQIIADCTNKRVLLPRVRDSTVVGAAILGTVGSGVYSTFEEAIDKMFHVEERRQPILENVPVYEQQYRTYNKLLNAEMAELLTRSSYK
jgi:xylulokinase